MTSPPGGSLLPPSDRALFGEQFEKDLQFFQLLLLLINKSCPIKNVDLAWIGSKPLARSDRQMVGTTQALEKSCSRLFGLDRANPNPRFCNVVSDNGRHPCCSISDRAAEERVRQTGRPEVYRCHAGLIDIAVPVLCDGQQIATLYSGQVMTTPPSPQGFVQIRANVREIPHIDYGELEAAYKEVPVVSDADIQQTVGILELFADYLATAWKRLRDAVEAQQRRLRDAQLQRKEMAHILLEGDISDRARLRELTRATGFTRYPNRVLVVKPDAEAAPGAPASSEDLAFTKALYAIEELSAHLENVMVAYLRRRGICVFFADSGPGDVKAYALAQRILYRIAERCDLRVRIGIGRAKSDWRRLVESYQEAGTALTESDERLATYKKPPAAVRALSEQVDVVCRALAERNLRDAKTGVEALPMLANRRLGEGPENLPAQRQFFLSAFESAFAAAHRLGLEGAGIEPMRAEGLERLELAPSIFDLQESWVAAADAILQSVANLYSGKHEKLVERARSIIERRMGRDDESSLLSLIEVAAAVGVSAGHLSRTFKKVTGSTFERYLMERRVERAQRLLLDPLSRVSEVAEKCDFCNPAYFARVFRKLAGCSPTEFSKSPIQFGLRQNTNGKYKCQ
ncbi:MAG TPA: PocR ligand-binding domain-containing protein [Bryobacteraceae bacterium]|nr:PocR ligand-binding domain-containing protein [Bryobacteraceae bacterium]